MSNQPYARTRLTNQLTVAVDDNDSDAALERFALSQSVLDHAPVGMVITSADDVIIWANLAMDAFVGITRAKLVRSWFLPFVHPEDRAAPLPRLGSTPGRSRDP